VPWMASDTDTRPRSRAAAASRNAIFAIDYLWCFDLTKARLLQAAASVLVGTKIFDGNKFGPIRTVGQNL
jgi:hypothetical protein